MDIFIIKLILSFFVGAVWITLLSIFAEKLGTKIGGAIAGIPATMVVALFFIGYTQTPEIASQSTTIIPLIIGINSLFILSYVALSKLRLNFFLALFISLFWWFTLSFIFVLIKFNNFFYSIIGFILLISFCYYIFEKKLNIISQGKKKIKYTLSQIIFRAVISGLVIAFAVLMAKISGPLLGGVFASFPALAVALILITHFKHGFLFTLALLKNFVIVGSINVLFFVIAIRYTYLYLGLFTGTIIALLISLICAYLTYQLINKPMK